MERRDFVKKATLLGVGASLLPQIVFAEQSDTARKLELIKDLKLFAKEHLELDFKKDFYSDWSLDDKLHYYLYVSSADKVQSPPEIKDYLYFGANHDGALAKQKEYIEAGYHTLIYSREAAHDYTITNSLLSFSDECLALVIFHDATHQHLSKHGRLSVKLEEATCEVMGTFGAQFYAEKHDVLDLKKVKKLNKLLDKTYIQVNKLITMVSDDKTKNEQIYRRFENRMFGDFERGNAFLKERFIHPVNNAYLLKNQYYAEYFKLIKSVAEKDKFISTFLYTMEHLPKKEEKAVAELREMIKDK